MGLNLREAAVVWRRVIGGRFGLKLVLALAQQTPIAQIRQSFDAVQPALAGAVT